MMNTMKSDEALLMEAQDAGLLLEYFQDPDKIDTDELMQLVTELERGKLIENILDNDPETVADAMRRLGWTQNIVEEMDLRKEENDE